MRHGPTAQAGQNRRAFHIDAKKGVDNVLHRGGIANSGKMCETVLHPEHGRVAQRERSCLTSKRSQVRTLPRPPRNTSPGRRWSRLPGLSFAQDEQGVCKWLKGILPLSPSTRQEVPSGAPSAWAHRGYSPAGPSKCTHETRFTITRQSTKKARHNWLRRASCRMRYSLRR